MNRELWIVALLLFSAACAYLAAEVLRRVRRTKATPLTAKEEQTALAIAFLKTALESLRRLQDRSSQNYLDAWMFCVRAAVQLEAAVFSLRHEMHLAGTSMDRDTAFGIVINEVWRHVYGRSPESAEIGGASLKWRCVLSLESDVNDVLELQEQLIERRNEADARELAARMMDSEIRLLRLFRLEFPER